MQMKTLSSKLHEKHTKLKTRRKSEMDQFNHEQEVKFMNYVSDAEELIEHLRSENDRLHAQINDVASIRSAKEGQYAEHQKLLIEEAQKTALGMDSGDSQTEVECKGKGKQFRWSHPTDSVLIETLVEQGRLGHKTRNGWKGEVYSVVADAIAARVNEHVTRKHIESRLRTMKTEYRTFCALKGMSGFGWDSIKNTVTAPDDVWNELLKKQPKYRFYRGRRCKWDFETLGIIIGHDNATGNVAKGGLDCQLDVNMANGGDGNDDLPRIDKDTSPEDFEEGGGQSSACTGKRPSSFTQKRQHYKKLRGVEVVKDVIDGLNVRIDAMAKSIHYLSFSKDLYTEVMKVEGFSRRYLDRAFALLRRDALEGEFFLVRDVESRKEMLEEMHEKIGDV